ncbi:MAG: 16S rRNA (cytosine(967)-C(5))-methyltransferase RsmB, partial [Candidatus Eisenbacteria bacterium]|nr:16S rRNA (cytosine(967)-C(5))-methyltransferase RsmB [Candidatus Eisenbacteria bacterium]
GGSRPGFAPRPGGDRPGASRGPRPDSRRGGFAGREPRPDGRTGPPPTGEGHPRRPWHERRRDADSRAAAERDRTPLSNDPREAALRILHAAETRGAFTDRLLDGAHTMEADDRDRALMHEIVKGTLRWRGRLDFVLDKLVHMGIERVQPWIRNVLRMGAYQILFLDRVPVHAAVDESVKLAHRHGHPGTAGLVNSVLRRLVEEKHNLVIPEGDDLESLAVWGSHPVWMVRRWLERFGVEQTRALMLANNRAAAIGLRANRTRTTPEALVQSLANEGQDATLAKWSPDLVWIEGRVAPGGLNVFRGGECTAQDESEALVGRLVAPERFERVLDLCAAPGGKCSHLAELMGDEGEVWALDRAPERVTSLKGTVERLGLQSIHVVEGDGRAYTFPMPFDRVLVDAPCSGLGVLARRADARWRKGADSLVEMPPIQLELLAAGARRVRPGGVVVYSVCSFEPEETEQVVEQFLQQNPGFELESAKGYVPDAVVDERGFMRVLPHLHGCDGAFAARFRRSSGASA